MPPTTALSGISLVTTAPAPIVTLSPMVIFPIIMTPAPKVTLFPITGVKSFLPSHLLPIVER